MRPRIFLYCLALSFAIIQCSALVDEATLAPYIANITADVAQISEQVANIRNVVALAVDNIQSTLQNIEAQSVDKVLQTVDKLTNVSNIIKDMHDQVSSSMEALNAAHQTAQLHRQQLLDKALYNDEN
eukprot:PhF_6_TR19116/c0_g2_i4/m.28122